MLFRARELFLLHFVKTRERLSSALNTCSSIAQQSAATVLHPSSVTASTTSALRNNSNCDVDCSALSDLAAQDPYVWRHWQKVQQQQQQQQQQEQQQEQQHQ
jgi:hypothetical protein